MTTQSEYARNKIAYVESIAPRAATVTPRIRPTPDYGIHSRLINNNEGAFSWIAANLGSLTHDLPLTIEAYERATANPHVAQPSQNIARALERITAAHRALGDARQYLINAGYAGTWLDSEDDE